MSQQIPLDLAIAPDFSQSAFISGACNSEALSALAIGKWANNCLAIAGPKGSGKTHIGHIWAQNLDAIRIDPAKEFIPTNDMKGRAIWVDNAAGADEFALFTLINLAIAGDITALLLTDRAPPGSWAVEIPDLNSRLRNVTTVRVDEPDDQLLSAIIDKLFKDRGLKVADNVISYLILHADRSVASLRALIASMDKQAASEKVNVTRTFAAKYMQQRLF